MNTIRLPFGYFEMMNEDGTMKSSAFDRMDWFINESAKRGLYVILDMHAAPGSQNGKDHSGDISVPDKGNLFKNETNMARTVFLWEQIAERYKGNPTIATYDLLNEPGGALHKEQWDFYDTLYKAIRAKDPDHIITVESIWEPMDMPDPALYGWENVIYSYHFYGWDNTNSSISQKTFTDSKVPMVNELTKYNVPLLVGEFSLFSNLQSWEYALNLYEEQDWMWTTWSYKTVNQGSWGLYNGNPSKVNITTDSYETILSKWSNVDTARVFSKNHYYADTISNFADPARRTNNSKKWYQNFEGETVVEAGTNATADIDSERAIGTGKSAKLVVTGSATPTGTQQYVSIKPSDGETFDASFAKYLVINGYNATSTARTVYVTLVDKDGKLSSTVQTHTNTTLLSNQWSKTALLLSSAGTNADLSAIKEIRIAMRFAGTYYFDNIFFGQSFSDAAPVTQAPLTASASLTGPESVTAGLNVDLTYGLKNTDKELVAQDVTISYDSTKLEFVPHPASLNEQRFVIADYLGVHLEDYQTEPNKDLMKLSFRALPDSSAGPTSITISNVIVADGNGVESILAGDTHLLQINVLDKAALLALISQAQSAHDTAVEGKLIGQYPAGTKATLQSTINAAIAVAQNANVTQNTIARATSDLAAALQSFQSLVIVSIPGDINQDQRVSVGDLAVMAKSYGMKSTDAGWSLVSKLDLNGDNQIDIVDLVMLSKMILNW
jgi:endoglucanase